MKKINKIVFQIITVCIGCILAFVIAELGIRLVRPQMTGPIQVTFDPELGPIPVPHQHGRRTIPGVYSYSFNNNSLGLRGKREYAYEKTSDLRILLLGDSFCYGYGVDDDQTFAYGIERNLSSKNCSVEVMNAGNGGQGTDYALKFFKTLGYKFKPDLTVLCFFQNDFADNGRSLYYSIGEDGNSIFPKSLSNSLEAKKEVLKRVPIYNWLISWSHVANLLKQAALKILVRIGKATQNRAFGLIIHYGDDSRMGYSNDQNVKLTAIFIRYLREITMKAGSDLIVLYIPSAVEVEQHRKGHKLSKDERTLNGLLESQHIALLSLTPVISCAKAQIPILYYKEGHWTPLAHSITANYVSERIKERFEKVFPN